LHRRFFNYRQDAAQLSALERPMVLEIERTELPMCFDASRERETQRSKPDAVAANQLDIAIPDRFRD
jgi:hypothetical protein